MHELRIGLEPDFVARLELVTLAEYRDHVVTAELGDDLDLGAGRLDDQDFGLRTVIDDAEMLRPNAVDDRSSVGIPRYVGDRQAHAARPFHLRLAVDPHGALERVHGGRPDETGDKELV